MRKVLKKIINFLAKYSKIVDLYYVQWGIIGGAPTGLLIINFIFQRIFRINSKFKTSVHFTSRLIAPEKISYSSCRETVRSFCFSGHVYIQALNGVTLGEDVLFAPGVKIISSNHDFNERSRVMFSDPVIIGNNVWLGVNSLILPGVKIADDCIIGAGSVVTKSIDIKGAIVAGNPAKVISMRKL